MPFAPSYSRFEVAILPNAALSMVCFFSRRRRMYASWPLCRTYELVGCSLSETFWPRLRRCEAIQQFFDVGLVCLWLNTLGSEERIYLAILTSIDLKTCPKQNNRVLTEVFACLHEFRIMCSSQLSSTDQLLPQSWQHESWTCKAVLLQRLSKWI